MSADVYSSGVPSQPRVETTNSSLLWPMQYAPKLSLFDPSDLSKERPKQKKLKIPTGYKKDTFCFLERVVEEDEDEKPPEPLPPLDGLRGAIGRATISRGITYTLPSNEGKVSIQNIYNSDLSALFKKTHAGKKKAKATAKKPTKSSSSTSLPELSQGQHKTALASQANGRASVPLAASGTKLGTRTRGKNVRLRRSCLQIQPEVKELLDSFGRCEPYSEPVESEEQMKVVERVRQIKSAGDSARRTSSLRQEKTFMTDDKLDMVWTWLNKEDEAEKKKREEEDESWMYE